MGFHICEYCKDEVAHTEGQAIQAMPFGPYSSADVTLRFANGHSWQFPHVGLLHYVTVHNYLPSQEFIHDVMKERVAAGVFMQTKGLATQIGYLSGPNFPSGDVPNGFVVKLMALVKQAKRQRLPSFRQTRSA